MNAPKPYYSVELKVKRLSLAAENRIIRNEMRRMRRAGKCPWSLHSHLVSVVRPEARLSHLAHAYVTGRMLSEVEKPGSDQLSANEWAKVGTMVVRFWRNRGGLTSAEVMEDIKAWSEGEAPLTDRRRACGSGGASNPRNAGSTPDVAAN